LQLLHRRHPRAKKSSHVDTPGVSGYDCSSDTASHAPTPVARSRSVEATAPPHCAVVPPPPRNLALCTRECKDRFTGKDAAELRHPRGTPSAPPRQARPRPPRAAHPPRVAAPPASDLALRGRSGGGTFSARGLYAKRRRPRTKAAAPCRRR